MPDHLRDVALGVRELTPEETARADALEARAVAEYQAAEAEALRIARVERWEKSLPTRGLGHARLADLLPGQDTDGKVSGWLDGDARVLLLQGEKAGNGKTTAAYAVGNEAVARGLWCAAWLMGDLWSALRPGDESRTITDPPEWVWATATRCDVLILDDLASENLTEWRVAEMFRLADTRYRAGLRTVVTTNRSYDDLLRAYGEPTVDRLVDDAVIAKFTGESIRKPRPF